MTATNQVLYRFFDAADALLYVGITANPGARWNQHRSDRPWWAEVARVSLEIHSTKAEARAAEARAIKAELPRYNVTHKPVALPPRTHSAPDDMVGTAEIAHMLGVTVGRVWQLRQQPGFPPPAYRLRGSLIWHTTDITEWAEGRGRTIRSEPES